MRRHWVGQPGEGARLTPLSAKGAISIALLTACAIVASLPFVGTISSTRPDVSASGAVYRCAVSITLRTTGSVKRAWRTAAMPAGL